MSTAAITALYVLAGLLFAAIVWCDRDKDPKPVVVIDVEDAEPKDLDEFTSRLLNVLHAVEENPTLLDDLDRFTTVTDDEITQLLGDGGPA